MTKKGYSKKKFSELDFLIFLHPEKNVEISFYKSFDHKYVDIFAPQKR